MSGSLVYDPSQLSGLYPLGNPSGMSTGGPTSVSGSSGPVLGGTSSPFVPAPTGSSNMPSATGGMPAYASPYAASGTTATLAGLTPGTSAYGFTGGDLAQSLQHTYYGGAGTLLADFLKSGAGFNPAVAQALIAAMQPQIAQGQANLMEQYGSTGTGGSSAGQLGLAGYEAQTNLDVGQLLAGLYEQSVQNFMQVLMGTAGQGVNYGQQAGLALLNQVGGVSQAAAKAYVGG